MDNKGKETIELLTRAEAARYLNICLSSLDKLINDRKFYGKVNIGRYNCNQIVIQKVICFASVKKRKGGK